MTVRGVAAVLAAGTLVLGAAGCAGSPSVTAPPSSAPAVASGPVTAPSVSEATVSAAATPTPTGGAQQFGSTFTWADGVAVTVSPPRAFTPSSTAVSMANNSAPGKTVVLDVTLRNGGKEPVDPYMLTLRASSGDAEAGQVFDYERGVNAPSAPVQPGKSMKWRVAFERPAPDLTVTVNWNFGTGSGTYTG